MKVNTAGLFLLVLTACTNKNGNENQSADLPPVQRETTRAFISPPLPHAVTDVEEFTFDARKGDTLFSRSGSILVFPAGSLVDKDGKPVTGDVKVDYEEFRDAADIFLSGIPMEYSSGDTSYTFESAGMMRIGVTSKGSPVFPNAANKPQVNMTTGEQRPGFDLYFLDTLQKKWRFLETNEAVDVAATQITKKRASSAGQETVTRPEAPVKAKPGQPFFEIEIDYDRFPELKVYRNVKFEIHESVKNFDPKHADIDWEDVVVQKAKTEGLYQVQFRKQKQQVTYLTRPVLMGPDYDAALREFNRRNDEYNAYVKNEKAKATKARSDQEEWQKKEDAITAQNEKVRALNKLIDARNAATELKNTKTEKQNAETRQQIKEALEAREKNRRDIASNDSLFEVSRRKFDSIMALGRRRAQRLALIRKMMEANDPQLSKADPREITEVQEQLTGERLFKSFALSGFGIYNCDHPSIRDGKEFVVEYRDESDNPLSIPQSTFMRRGFKGIFTFYNNTVKFTQEPHGGFAIVGEQIFYLPYKAFGTQQLDSINGRGVLRLRSVRSEMIKSSSDLRALLDFGS
jgi:hypothetical protein